MNSTLTKTLSKYSTIVFVGGGTGGHIQPVVSLSKLYTSSKKLFWIGGNKSTEQSTAKSIGINFRSIPTLKLSTTRSPKILLYPFVLFYATLVSIYILLRVKKKHANLCVFSKGGPGAVSIGFAAWILRIPLYIHESDSIPGRSNQTLARLATKIFVGFESSKQYFSHKNIFTIGQILDPVFSEEKSKRKNPWKTQKPHLIILCGSQGARSVFLELLKHIAPLTKKYEICIPLGKLNESMQKDFEDEAVEINSLHVYPWISQENLVDWMAYADLAITRGSATSLAELDTFGIKKIIIPLPSAAKNHQYHNAKIYETKGDTLLEQKDISKLYTLLRNFS